MQKKQDQANNNSHATKDSHEFVLRLFITGATPNSIRALTNIKNICEAHLKDRYNLEIIDVYQQQEIAEKEQLIALPLLIKIKPMPQRRIIGDLSDTQKVLKALGLIRE